VKKEKILKTLGEQQCLQYSGSEEMDHLKKDGFPALHFIFVKYLRKLLQISKD